MVKLLIHTGQDRTNTALRWWWKYCTWKVQEPLKLFTLWGKLNMKSKFHCNPHCRQHVIYSYTDQSPHWNHRQLKWIIQIILSVNPGQSFSQVDLRNPVDTEQQFWNWSSCYNGTYQARVYWAASEQSVDLMQGKQGRHKVVSDFDKSHIVVVRWLGQCISKQKHSWGCFWYAVVSN